MISHVIPCYENADLTKECLEYYFTNRTNQSEELIIINDGSKEDYSFLKNERGISLVISHSENLGFPKSVNAGIYWAVGDFVAIWNNDILVAPGWLEPIIQCFSKDTEHKYGMLGPKIYEPCHMSKEAFFNSHPRGWNDNLSHEIQDWHKGCPWVFRREVLDRVGKFDERFFPTQYEDSDYLLRMALDGYKHGVVSNTAVFHYSSYTQNKNLIPKYGKSYPNINRKRFEEKWGTCDISYENAYEGKGWTI